MGQPQEEHNNLSQENIEDLRSEFTSVGGIVTVLPDIQEVRDHTEVMIKAPTSDEEEQYDIWKAINGSWFHISRVGKFRLHSTGCVYQDNSNSTIAIAGVDTLTPIIDSDWVLFHEDGMEWIPDEGVFRVDIAGEYLGVWSISFTASAANQDIEVGWILNETRFGAGWAHRKISTASDTGNFGSPLLGDIKAGDKVGLGVVNTTSGADLIIQHASITLNRIR